MKIEFFWWFIPYSSRIARIARFRNFSTKMYYYDDVNGKYLYLFRLQKTFYVCGRTDTPAITLQSYADSYKKVTLVSVWEDKAKWLSAVRGVFSDDAKTDHCIFTIDDISRITRFIDKCSD